MGKCEICEKETPNEYTYYFKNTLSFNTNADGSYMTQYRYEPRSGFCCSWCANKFNVFTSSIFGILVILAGFYSIFDEGNDSLFPFGIIGLGLIISFFALKKWFFIITKKKQNNAVGARAIIGFKHKSDPAYSTTNKD